MARLVLGLQWAGRATPPAPSPGNRRSSTASGGVALATGIRPSRPGQHCIYCIVLFRNKNNVLRPPVGTAGHVVFACCPAPWCPPVLAGGGLWAEAGGRRAAAVNWRPREEERLVLRHVTCCHVSRVTCHVSRAPPGEGHVEDVLVVAAGHEDGEADGQQRRPGAGAAPRPGYSQHDGMGPRYIVYLVMRSIRNRGVAKSEESCDPLGGKSQCRGIGV